MKTCLKQLFVSLPLIGAIAVFPGCAPSLQPSRVSLSPAYQQQFAYPQAAVKPADLNWVLSPNDGTISAEGLYTAPPCVDVPAEVTVTATEPSNTQHHASAVITLLHGGNASCGVDLKPYVLTPSHVYLRANHQQKFKVSVEGKLDSSATWSINPSDGKISTDGLYTSPDQIPSQEDVTVTAVSVTYPGKTAGSIVTLVPEQTVYNPGISLLPSHVSLRAAHTQQFKSTLVDIKDNDLNWSVFPDYGKVSQSGFYTAPNQVNNQQDVTVTAASRTYPDKKASSVISLIPENYGVYQTALTLLPSHVSLRATHAQQFKSTLVNINDNDLDWSIFPETGKISRSGLYTSPEVVNEQEDVTVIAASRTYPDKKASSVVTLMPAAAAGLTLRPLTADLDVSGTQQFTAECAGDVAWSISPNAGTVTRSGLYTAPALTLKKKDVTVTAACNNLKASATVHLIPLKNAPEKVSAELHVLFDTAKSVIKPEFYMEIKQVADYMEAYPNTIAEIEGHTDNVASEHYNMALSQKRADAVRDYLIQKFNISPSRLTARGYGPTRPVADNNTDEGRQKNRRVVATLTTTKTKTP
jgi:outer membrane protein OmpA-like peptidoglycan-associated protein